MKELIKASIISTLVIGSAYMSLHGYELAMSMLDGMVDAAYGSSTGVLSESDQQIQTEYYRRTGR